MNIFFLDENPQKAAQSLCDKHVVKMVLETAQMCSTAVQQSFQLDPLPSTYKPAYVNHPMTLWVGEKWDNMNWALNHGMAIAKEYTHRYGRIHKSQKVLEDIAEHYFPVLDWPHAFRISTPPLCMPDVCKEGMRDDIGWLHSVRFVDAYRLYYNEYKRPFAKYTKRERPEWLKK